MDARVNSLEARMAEILENHFQNYQNPHETILQMWTLLNLHGYQYSTTINPDQTKH